MGKLRIISAKKPSVLLCSKNIDTLPLGEQLRVMRLRKGYTNEQAARAIGVPRNIRATDNSTNKGEEDVKLPRLCCILS